MAASTGGESMEEKPTVENASKLPNSLQQSAEKPEDVSTNGTISCSSFAAARKGPNIFLQSTCSPNAASETTVRVFGSDTSTSQFNVVKSPLFGNVPRKNSIFLRPSVFSLAEREKDMDLKRSFNSFGVSPRKTAPVLLRASQLGSSTSPAATPASSTTNNSIPSFVLSPAKLSNPFCKAALDNDDSSSTSETTTCSEASNIPSQESEKANSSKQCSEVSKVSFVPLASSDCASSPCKSQPQAPTGATPTVPTFVFGQNLHERVEVSSETVRSEAETSGAAATNSSNCSSEASVTNGVTPEMLFTSVIQRERPDIQSEMANDERKRKSLSEAAREYEESRAVKRKYEEVTVKTGEEEEINILQINCKLFAFNKDKSNWVERGRGTLRLNDLSVENRTQSRVVMRVSGSLRVVLNTKIWAEMTVDRPSDKSVRLTALDSSGEIKVFLVMAGVKEIDQLFKALDWRVSNQKKLAAASEKSTETNAS
ncbi:LOW QUALITY PROTEIN: ran-binding protein 3-like [Homalodisca vitripennis]|uniref:LOW QUALITY PROTEIN: ran-binding protein 3-like n=1 Tax=Homalodisca vitripennis TaxID=197043 RepID=UPI001EEB4D92|nr:LOW QUALITY PROTEIN: ran-binding protein 3-like [Homalodisca vitripennis]